MKANKVLWWLFYIFLIFNIGDVISTFFIYEAESNPIFLSFKNPSTAFIVLSILKIVFIYTFYKIIKNNKFDNEQTHFLFMLILVYVDIVLILAVSYNTYAGFFNTQIVQEGSTISKEVRGSLYIKQMLILVYIPMAISYLTFRLWLMSRKQVIYKFATVTYDEWIRCRLK
jgi:hypothetical protein